MSKDRNYNETYACDVCKKDGRRLWRDYSTFLSHQTLICASCIHDELIAKAIDEGKMAPAAFVYKEQYGFTDQCGGRVPAITTEEGDTFWGYSSCPADRIIWWYAMPTYPDQLRLELDCQTNTAKHFVRQAQYMGKKWKEELDENNNLHFQLDSVKYWADGFDVTIWGQKVEPVDQNDPSAGYVRYGDYERRTLNGGDKIALWHGRAYVLPAWKKDLKDALLIMEFDQDGEAFVKQRLAEGKLSRAS